MPHKPRKCMFSKKTVVVSTAAGTGMKQAIKDITNTLFYWGVPYVKSYDVGVQALNWDGVSAKRKQQIEKTTEKMAKKFSLCKPAKPGMKTKFMYGIMRMMEIKNWGSSPEEKAYWEEMGWLGKVRPWDM